MTCAEAAKALGISRPAVMKHIRVGSFTIGGHDLRASRDGHKWDIEFVRDGDSQEASARGRANRSRRKTGAVDIQDLRAQKLLTDIKLGEQKLAEHDRQLRRRFASIVSGAFSEAGSNWASHIRALRLSAEQADDVTRLSLKWRDELRRLVAVGVSEWEEEFDQ